MIDLKFSQLLLRPTEQNDTMLGGLAKITDLLSLYKVRLERYYARGFKSLAFEDGVVLVFSKIIEYQARCIRRLSRRSVRRYAGDLAGSDDWQQSLEIVLDKDRHLQSMSDLVDKQFEDAALQAQFRSIAVQVDVNREMVRILSQWRDQQYELHVNKSMEACLHALSSSYRDHLEFNRKRVPNTCKWFLDSDKFAAWKATNGPSVLCLTADPGCGKSVLSRCLIDEDELPSSILGSTVCYFFFKEGLDGRQTRADALSAILHQLFTANPALLQYAMAAYRSHGPSLNSRSSELWDILVSAADDTAAGDVIVLLDALDECKPEECKTLIGAIGDLICDASTTKLKFFVTSRPYTRIEHAMTAMQSSVTYVRVPGEDQLEAIGQEIDLVVEIEVPLRLVTLSRDYHEKVIQMLRSKRSRTYLWLRLVLDLMEEKLAALITSDDLNNAVDSLPSTVFEAYSAILNKCPSPQKATTLLQLVVAAREPLGPEELLIALAVASSKSIKFDAHLATPPPAAKSNVKNICGLLLTISHGKVYLLHETAREFLVDTSSTNHDLAQDWQHFDVTTAERTMARSCIVSLGELDKVLPETFLTSGYHHQRHDDDIHFILGRLLPKSLKSQEQIHFASLVGYAAKFWYIHARSGIVSSDDTLIPLVCKLLEGDRTSCILWYGRVVHEGWVELNRASMHKDKRLKYTPLTLAVMFDQAYAIETLVAGGSDVDGPTEYTITGKGIKYGSAVCAAASCRSLASLKVLVKLSANLNEQSGRVGSPLWAARRSSSCFSYLLEAGADMNAKGPEGNVFEKAAWWGDYITVKRCLAAGADDFNGALEANKVGYTMHLKRKYINLAVQEQCSENYEKSNRLLNDVAAAANPHHVRILLK